LSPDFPRDPANPRNPSPPVPAVFLDRDGTINVDDGYTYLYKDFRLVPGAIEAMKLLGDAGFTLIVVTNQAGIAKKFYEESDVLKLHRRVLEDFEKEGIRVAGFYFCPHHPMYTGPCECRKPAPGMILRGAREHNVDLSRSHMVGDKLSDLKAGLAAGVDTILVRTGYGAGIGEVPAGVRVAEDILGAAKLILRDPRN
jgi:D-glycero-D-manno-heptose 1,7-bisphosphate phosphatase